MADGAIVNQGLKLEQRHGKSRVRVGRVWKDSDGTHHFVEWNVGILLLSDCLPAYDRGDNSSIVATDTMKNTVSFCFGVIPLCLQLEFICEMNQDCSNALKKGEKLIVSVIIVIRFMGFIDVGFKYDHELVGFVVALFVADQKRNFT